MPCPTDNMVTDGNGNTIDEQDVGDLLDKIADAKVKEAYWTAIAEERANVVVLLKEQVNYLRSRVEALEAREAKRVGEGLVSAN